MPRRATGASAPRVVADLPRGTQVEVISQQGAWLQVQATLGGTMLQGYVSQELIEYVPSSTPRVVKTNAPAALPPKKSRLFFAIYYRVKDHAFKRAADTWERETRAVFLFDDKVDLFLSIEVGTESEFKSAWKKVHMESTGKFATVVQGQIFSHASITRFFGNSDKDGLEFQKDPSENGTLLKAEIQSLAPLNWHPTEGHLILSGCNSGVMGSRKWAPAEIFARSQKVRTTGQTGFAYFSTDPSKYVRIDDSSTHIYLWAFERKQNGFTGNGDRMEGMTFNP